MKRAITSTYRLQLRGPHADPDGREFGFAQAADIVPYLASLGVSHLYLSPIFASAPESNHNYDVIDPTVVNPELGGIDGLRLLARTAHEAGLGLVVDIVPNHLGVEVPRRNPWWWDVLKHGKDSDYAHFFDIDWAQDNGADGKLGLPALGGVGCGWATGIVMWCSLLGMLWWVRWAPAYRARGLFLQFDWPQWPVIRRLLSVGLPIGVSIFAESSIFSVIALLIGGLGATVVAGHQIALNFSSMIFMIPYSLAMAATVRVGQSLGRSAPRDARFAAGVAMGTALTYACLSASLVMLLREPIARIYSPDPEVIVMAATLLVYSALFQFSDAIQVTAAGALRGYQDTRATMVFTLFAYWGIGLPVGYTLGLSDWLGQPSGPSGLWQGLVAGLTCAAVLLGIRLARSARRHIRA